MGKYGRVGQAAETNQTWRMDFAYWITKATDTHSEYVISIVFAWRQCLCEHASMFCLYVHCLSNFLLHSLISMSPSFV